MEAPATPGAGASGPGLRLFFDCTVSLRMVISWVFLRVVGGSCSSTQLRRAASCSSSQPSALELRRGTSQHCSSARPRGILGSVLDRSSLFVADASGAPKVRYDTERSPGWLKDAPRKFPDARAWRLCDAAFCASVLGGARNRTEDLTNCTMERRGEDERKRGSSSGGRADSRNIGMVGMLPESLCGILRLRTKARGIQEEISLTTPCVVNWPVR